MTDLAMGCLVFVVNSFYCNKIVIKVNKYPKVSLKNTLDLWI